MATLAVLSDTHWSQPEWYFDELDPLLEGVDLIVHAGDAVDAFVLERLEKIAPLIAVTGNCDRNSIRLVRPSLHQFEFGGVHFGVFHGHQVDLKKPESIVQCFSPQVQWIFHGHTHLATMEKYRGRTIFNPGSLSEPRGGGVPTWGRIRVENGVAVAEHVAFDT